MCPFFDLANSERSEYLLFVTIRFHLTEPTSSDRALVAGQTKIRQFRPTIRHGYPSDMIELSELRTEQRAAASRSRQEIVIRILALEMSIHVLINSED